MRYLSLALIFGLSFLSTPTFAQDECTAYYKKLYEQGVPTQQINKLKKEIATLAPTEQGEMCERKMASK